MSVVILLHRRNVGLLPPPPEDSQIIVQRVSLGTFPRARVPMVLNTTELNPFNLCESFAKRPNSSVCVCANLFVCVCARVCGSASGSSPADSRELHASIFGDRQKPPLIIIYSIRPDYRILSLRFTPRPYASAAAAAATTNAGVG